MSLKRCRDDIIDNNIIKKYKSNNENMDLYQINTMTISELIHKLICINNKLEKTNNTLLQLENRIKILESINKNYEKKINILYKQMGNDDLNNNYIPSYIS
jgi:hypothetical protein